DRAAYRVCTCYPAHARRSSGRGRCPHAGQACTWGQCNEPFILSWSDASLLGRTAVVMRDRGHIRYVCDAIADSVQGTHSRLTARARALDADLEVFQTVV